MKKEKWKWFVKGNIVRWGKNIWIVEEVKDNGILLIAFWASNCSAFPSKTWPNKDALNSIEYVAECGKRFVTDIVQKSMEEIEEITMPHEEENDDLFTLQD